MSKVDSNQYKHVIGAVFGRKRFKNAAAQPGNENLVKQIQFVDVNKFVFYAFN